LTLKVTVLKPTKIEAQELAIAPLKKVGLGEKTAAYPYCQV